MKPSTRVTLKAYHGEKAAQQLIIASMVDEPFTITELSSSIDDKIEYKLTPVVKDKEYRLDIKTRSGIEESYRGKISLKTSNKKKPQIDIMVAASAETALRVSPQYFYFGIIDTSKEAADPGSLQRTALLHEVRDNIVTIKDIKTSKEWITAAADTKEKGKGYTITIKLNKDKVPKGNFRETVTINTESEKKSDAVILVVEGKVI